MDKQIIACDLDGTLAHYDGWKGIGHIGCIIPSVKQAILNAQSQGHEVWIFTARVSDPAEAQEAANVIDHWLEENGLGALAITATKHKFFTEFWDDRALQVIKNQGVFVIEADNHWQAAAQLANAPADEFVCKCDESGPTLITVPEEPRTPSSALDVQVGGDHYKKWKIQPIEFAHANNMPFLDANAFKYICRHADKNGVQDLRKAKHYLELIAEMVYGEKL